MRLSLGTAQFGLNYGISNKMGKIPEEEISRILDFAHKNDINWLDTSPLYGESESIIGNLIEKNNYSFNIVSKLPKGSDNPRISFFDSLKKLKVQRLYGYLIHDFSSFASNLNIFKVMQELRSDGLVEKVGFSLYYPRELEFLFSQDVRFDIVELPYNIFDQRFESWFERLNRIGIEIHVRSPFLQGLFFKDAEELRCHFQSVKTKLGMLREISLKENISVTELCLGFVFKQGHIDRVIVGIECLDNLIQHVEITKKTHLPTELHRQLKELKESNEEILVPMNWK